MKKQIPFIANSVHTAEVCDNVQGCQDFEDIFTLIIIIILSIISCRIRLHFSHILYLAVLEFVNSVIWLLGQFF